MDTKAIQNKFAERLLGLMQEKELNRTNLGEQVKIPRNTIGNWLSCKRTPQIDSLWKLSDFFGCSIDYLLGKEN